MIGWTMERRVLAMIAGFLVWMTVDTQAADPTMREVAERIAGGASLVGGSGGGRAGDEFAERAARFADAVRQGAAQKDVVSEWRRVKKAYRAVRRGGERSRDARWSFLVSHLDEDVAVVDRALGNVVGDDSDDGGSGEARTISLLRSEACIGTNSGEHACRNGKQTVTFALPRGTTGLRRIDAEWRDYGRSANAEVYLDDRLVWREDVNKDWDGDGKDLNLRTSGRSTITIRSSNGDPIWIRKLTVEVIDSEAGSERYEEPWNMRSNPWK